MKFKKLLSEAIDNNTKIIITGKSGWGKSEMIAQVAEEKGLELIDFRLSEVLPEDIVGVPKIRDDYYEYVPPRWLYEVLSNPDKKYLLFLDEITQGTPEVLNICYKIFDKVTKVGNHELPNVAVVGATNYASESNYLSELPEPLKKRACMLELDHNIKDALDFLMNKYSLTDTALMNPIKDAISYSNPRSTDKAIALILNNCCKELIIPFIGYQNYQGLSTLIHAAKKPEGLTKLDEALFDIKQGFTKMGKERCKLVEPDILKYKYNLTDEEMDVVNNEWSNLKTDVTGTTRNFFTLWAVENSEKLTGQQLLDLRDYKTFNALQYMQKMSMNETALTNQFEVLKELLNKDDKGLLRLFCEKRTPTIQMMRMYREDLPWDLLREAAKNNYLTENKLREFAKELGLK